jgi:hypothetical protein
MVKDLMLSKLKEDIYIYIYIYIHIYIYTHIYIYIYTYIGSIRWKLWNAYNIFLDWRLNIVKMSFLPSLIYRLNATLIKMSAKVLVHINKVLRKTLKGKKRPRLAKNFWENEEQSGTNHSPCY